MGCSPRARLGRGLLKDASPIGAVVIHARIGHVDSIAHVNEALDSTEAAQPLQTELSAKLYCVSVAANASGSLQACEVMRRLKCRTAVTQWDCVVGARAATF
jgi:hypothetical protein